jgi:hypothetical protein
MAERSKLVLILSMIGFSTIGFLLLGGGLSSTHPDDDARNELSAITKKLDHLARAPVRPTRAPRATAAPDIPPLLEIERYGKSFTPKLRKYGWAFKRYVSSRLELDFYREVGPIEKEEWVPAMLKKFAPQFEKMVADMKPRVVSHAPIELHAALKRECVEYIDNTVQGMPADSNDRTCLGSTQPMDHDIFSRFEYEFQCIDPPCDEDPPVSPRVGETHVSYIEPLVGILRHPGNFLQNNLSEYKGRKDYMLVDKWALHNLHTRYRRVDKTSHFFDLGASTYTAGAGGSSQNWFVGLGDCLCIPFDFFRMWEMTPLHPHHFWKRVPGRLHSNYMWYNYGLSAEPGNYSNPLNHLLAKVRYEDPVVVKVDFDTPALEIKLIETVMSTPDVYRRIDELFFEHHVDMPLIKVPWRTYNTTCQFQCTADVFLTLRQRGIRAHSWI